MSVFDIMNALSKINDLVRKMPDLMFCATFARPAHMMADEIELQCWGGRIDRSSTHRLFVELSGHPGGAGHTNLSPESYASGVESSKLDKRLYLVFFYDKKFQVSLVYTAAAISGW